MKKSDIILVSMEEAKATGCSKCVYYRLHPCRSVECNNEIIGVFVHAPTFALSKLLGQAYEPIYEDKR